MFNKIVIAKIQHQSAFVKRVIKCKTVEYALMPKNVFILFA